MAKKRVRWSGILNEPIGPKPKNEESPERARWQQEYIQRLLALCDRYSVPRDTPIEQFWGVVAQSLLKELVPGFSQAPAKKGRRPNPDIFGIGVAVLELIREKPGMSERSACFALVKREEFSRYKADTLYRRYKLLKQRTATDGGSGKLLREILERLSPFDGAD